MVAAEIYNPTGDSAATMAEIISKGLDPGYSSSQPFLWPIVRHLLPKAPGARVLDLGCGRGIQARAAEEMGYKVVGVDVSKEAIDLARQTVPGGRFFVADIYDLPWAEFENAFDVVLAMEVIEHLHFPRRLLQAANRCLRPGGVFILSTPYHGYFKNLALSFLNKWDKHFNTREDGWHIKFFSPQTLRQLLGEEGFADIRFRFGGRLPFLWKSMVCRCRKRDCQ